MHYLITDRKDFQVIDYLTFNVMEYMQIFKAIENDFKSFWYHIFRSQCLFLLISNIMNFGVDMQ